MQQPCQPLLLPASVRCAAGAFAVRRGAIAISQANSRRRQLNSKVFKMPSPPVGSALPFGKRGGAAVLPMDAGPANVAQRIAAPATFGRRTIGSTHLLFFNAIGRISEGQHKSERTLTAHLSITAVFQAPFSAKMPLAQNTASCTAPVGGAP